MNTAHGAADDGLDEQDGWLMIPSTASRVTDDDIQALRDADQR